MEPAAMLCRMTQHSAFSHPLLPLLLCSPELQTGLTWCPQAPAPPQQPHSHPQICPAGTLHHPNASPPSLPSLPHWSASTRDHIPAPLSSRGTSTAHTPRCLLPSQLLSWHTAHGTLHTGTLTILGIYGASHPQRITSSCSRNSQKLRGTPGTPICSVSSVGCASSYCPLAPSAYQRSGSTQPLSLATGAFT